MIAADASFAFVEPPAQSRVESPQTIEAQQRTVTRLIQGVRSGNRRAFDELLPLVYDELHRLAAGQRRRWQGDTRRIAYGISILEEETRHDIEISAGLSIPL